MAFLDNFNMYANEIGFECTVEYLLPIVTKIVIIIFKIVGY